MGIDCRERYAIGRGGGGIDLEGPNAQQESNQKSIPSSSHITT